MAVDSLVGELPTGAQTKLGDGYPVTVHSQEFCPAPATCQAHAAPRMARSRRLVPCNRCGGPRLTNLRGFVNGTQVALCSTCKASPHAKGKAPLFLQRDYRQAAGVAA